MSAPSVTVKDTLKKTQGSSESNALVERSQSKSELEQSLEDLIEAVAAKIPCNQEAPINQRHRRAFQKVMETYFKSLETAFPYKKLETVYNRHVEKENKGEK